MIQALITVIAPLDPARVMDAEAAIDALGNPAREDLRAALYTLNGDAGTHFVSLHAIRSRDGARGHLVLELSADGDEAQALKRLAAAVGDALRPVFTLASDWVSDPMLSDYLLAHRVKVGCGWFSNPGVVFSGTPSLTVGRIRQEAKLAGRVADLLGKQPGHMSGLERLENVRATIAADPDHAPDLIPGTAATPYNPPSRTKLIAQLASSFAATYLWPAGLLILVWAVIAGGLAAHALGPGAFLPSAWTGLWQAALVVPVLLLVLALAAYATLRKAEANDWVEDGAPDRNIVAAMLTRENRLTQNHMVSITQRKPGAVRWFTSRLVFWIVGELATHSYRPGFLSNIGTIHFARWVTPPGSPDVLFFSNFDSSWESYLEDFITRAHEGLTAIWSNSIGFPRSSNLFQDGATDGERFKRYARRSMQPTRFWFSAYPRLSTTEIRTNMDIRRGLSGAMTEDDAASWLALFGSSRRPASKLVSSEIQSLVFGGLKFLHYGTCLLFTLSEDRASARAWLRDISPHIAFNDGRRFGKDEARHAVVTLALGAPGLARLGLPAESLDTFPFAFLEGMVTEARARILGDTGANAPVEWRWGLEQPHAALLVYGRSAKAVAQMQNTLTLAAAAHGMAAPTLIPLAPIIPDKREEPFGFADGISQPVIRGTYKGLRNTDPIHLVEPGEFILGYPDNRGNIPPGPTLAATLDPANMLPLVGAPEKFGRATAELVRDVGRNGSFLVIRELEQDPAGFEAFCRTEADRLNSMDRLPPPYRVTPEFIGAKLVGRWKDGSSLIRNAYEPSSRDQITRHEATHPTTSPEHAQAIGPPRARSERGQESFGDNDFLFGTEDPEALRCPFGAHIRRANPRDSLDPGSDEQISISNRHRILRVGRQYAFVAEPAEELTAVQRTKPGLFFMCLNSDIERQFEFVQQTWLRSPSFHGLSCEKDPLLGNMEESVRSYTIPSRQGPVRLSSVPQFVTTRGGGYFFLPGKRLIDFLCTP